MTDPADASDGTGLSELDKKMLLHMARTTIEARVTGQQPPSCARTSPSLEQKRGAFVSLHRHGQLRGCIGFISAMKPLHQAVQEMAIAAAFQDPRFPPISKDELVDLDIEISVLTPLREIKDADEIQVGKHGIMIIKGQNSGLLLPQVATQYGWSREEFLEHTCMKAGLPRTAWKDSSSKILVFSADIF